MRESETRLLGDSCLGQWEKITAIIRKVRVVVDGERFKECEGHFKKLRDGIDGAELFMNRLNDLAGTNYPVPKLSASELEPWATRRETLRLFSEACTYGTLKILGYGYSGFTEKPEKVLERLGPLCPDEWRALFDEDPNRDKQTSLPVAPRNGPSTNGAVSPLEYGHYAHLPNRVVGQASVGQSSSDKSEGSASTRLLSEFGEALGVLQEQRAALLGSECLTGMGSFTSRIGRVIYVTDRTRFDRCQRLFESLKGGSERASSAMIRVNEALGTSYPAPRANQSEINPWRVAAEALMVPSAACSAALLAVQQQGGAAAGKVPWAVLQEAVAVCPKDLVDQSGIVGDAPPAQNEQSLEDELKGVIAGVRTTSTSDEARRAREALFQSRKGAASDVDSTLLGLEAEGALRSAGRTESTVASSGDAAAKISRYKTSACGSEYNTSLAAVRLDVAAKGLEQRHVEQMMKDTRATYWNQIGSMTPERGRQYLADTRKARQDALNSLSRAATPEKKAFATSRIRDDEFRLCLLELAEREKLFGADHMQAQAQQASASCREALRRHDSDVAQVQRLPLPPGNHPIWQRVMWATGEAGRLIETHCRADPNFATMRQEHAELFKQAESRCVALMPPNSRCPGPNAYR